MMAPIMSGRGVFLGMGVVLGLTGCGDSGAVCGAGTHEVDGVCLPAAADAGVTVDARPAGLDRYEIRVAVSSIPADGYSKIPVLVIGTAADGTPALDRVVVNTTRAGAGTFSPATVTLTPVGATVYFTPCTSATPGCVGAVGLTLARATAPQTVVAQTDVELVAPAGVGSPAPCLAGGNLLFMDGMNDYIFTGTQTVREGAWSASGDVDDNINIHVDPSDSELGLWWDLTFSTEQLGQPLMEQVYEMAERAPFASPGHPGLSLSGDGRGCNTLTGRFQIHELDRSGDALRAITATFEQHCEGGLGVVRGCVHYEP
jgi:hypothetical protein